jgi:uncharacterized damage-inducible protein DinB
MRPIFQMFANYNCWANARLYAAAAQLPDAEYRADHGAFFKSVHGTLNHLPVGDRIWMQRLTGKGDAPARLDAILFEDLEPLRAARAAEDARIVAFISGLSDDDLKRATRPSAGRRRSSRSWATRCRMFSITRPIIAARCTRCSPRSRARRRRSISSSISARPVSGLAEQLAEILVEHAVLGVGGLAAGGELLEPNAERLAHLIAGQERRLIEQRHAAPRATELIVMMQEFLPFGAAGRGRIDAQGSALPAIGQQRLDIAGDGIAHARQVAAIAGGFLVGEAEVAIRSLLHQKFVSAL